MKKMFSFTLACIIAGTLFAQTNTTTTTSNNTAGEPAAIDPAANPNAPDFKWEEETHDFGTIPQGIPVSDKFIFTNTGKEPLIISNVQKTCGCTVTDWSKEPVMPGQKGFVSAEFNAAKEGPFTKAITVQSNAKTPNLKLYFKGTVQKSEQAGSVPEQKTIFNSDNK